MRVFADGSSFFPQDVRRQRAGFGVFYGDGHPHNVSKQLEGPLQDNFAAELRAVLYAFSTTTVPVWVTTDCQGVVDGVSAIIGGGRQDSLDNTEVWDAISSTVRASPEGFFHITWIKAHSVDGVGTNRDNFEEQMPQEFRGLFTYEELQWNQRADILAKQGVSKHSIDEDAHFLADARVGICTACQRMHVRTWGGGSQNAVG